MPVDVLTRAEKGDILEYDELDKNFTDLQDAVNASRPEFVSVTSASYTPSNLRVMLVDATASDIDINLPDPSTNANKEYIVKRVDGTANVVTINPNGSETIDGDSSVSVNTQWETVRLFSDGSNWFIL